MVLILRVSRLNGGTCSPIRPLFVFFHDTHKWFNISLLSQTWNTIFILSCGELVFGSFQATESTLNFEIIWRELMPINRVFALSKVKLSGDYWNFVFIKWLSATFNRLFLAQYHFLFSFCLFAKPRCSFFINWSIISFGIWVLLFFMTFYLYIITIIVLDIYITSCNIG